MSPVAQRLMDIPDKVILQDYVRKGPFLLQEKFLQENALNHAGSCRNFAGS